MPTPHDVLELPAGAPLADVQAAYRRLTVELTRAPPTTDTTARLRATTDAYRALSEASSPSSPSSPSLPPASASAPATSPARPYLVRHSGHLRSLLPNGALRKVGDASFELVLDAEEATTGGVAIVSLDADIVCRACDGGGCARCAGRGRERELVSCWLSVAPAVVDGSVVKPTFESLRLVQRPAFVVRTPSSTEQRASR